MATTTSSSTSVRSAVRSVGPVRNVRTVNMKKKRQSGYGLFFSDDEDEPIVERPSKVSPTPTSTITTTTTAKTLTSSVATAERPNQPKFQFNKGAALRPEFAASTSKIPSGRIVNKSYRDDAALHSSLSSIPQASASNDKLRASVGSSRSRIPARSQPYTRAPPPVRRRPGETERLLKDDIERKQIQQTSPVSRFTMRGAASDSKPLPPSDAPTTPNRNVFSRNGSATNTPTTPPKTPEPSTAQKKSWSEWLKDFIPDTVKKATPKKSPRVVNDIEKAIGTVGDMFGKEANGEVETSMDIDVKEKSYLLPGSFNESPVKVQQENNNEEKDSYTNILLLNETYNSTPITSPRRNGMYSPFMGSPEPTGRYSARPSRAIRGAGAGAGAYNKKGADIFGLNGPVLSKSSIGRSSRTHPYSRTSTSNTPARSTSQLVRLSSEELDEESRQALLEERLAELARKERDRRVQAQEERYERRLLESRLGRSLSAEEEGDGEMRDEESKPNEDAAIEDAEDFPPLQIEWRKDDKEAEPKEKETEKEYPSKDAASSPPASPPKATASSSFLFGGASYSPSNTVTPPTLNKPATTPSESRVTPASPEAAVPVDTTKFSFSSDSDKENSSSSPPRLPPPAPIMSHAQLPNLAPTPPSPGPATSPTKRTRLFDNAENMSQAASKARSQAEKFKPHVSSGLRASTTIQADSPPRKPVTEKTASSLFSPPPFTTTNTQYTPLFSSPPARELFPNSSSSPSSKPVPPATIFMSPSAVKEAKEAEKVVDVKAHIGLFTPAQLHTYTFPAITARGLGSVERQAVERVWTVPGKDEVGEILKALMAGMKPVPTLSK